MRTFVLVAISLCWAETSAQQIDVNGYSAAVIPGFEAGTVDSYQLVPALREEAEERGLSVYTDFNQLPPESRAGAMGLAFVISPNSLGAELGVTVVDLATGAIVSSVSENLVQWGTRRGFGRRLAREVWDEIGYDEFDAEAYDESLQSRNLLSAEGEQFGMTEEDAVRYFDDNLASLKSIEGIWTSVPLEGGADTHYKIGIVSTPGSATASFTAFVLESELPWWQPGDIKARIQGTAGPDVYMAEYSMADRSLQRITVGVNEGVVLETLTGDVDIAFVKNYPTGSSAPSTDVIGGSIRGTGTGFVVGRGVVVTNDHVVAAGNRYEFHTSDGQTFPLEVINRDTANDLATLRLLPNASGRYPSLLAVPLSTSPARLAEDVYTIGYPLSSVLGNSPRVTDGSVSAQQGLGGDPRFVQVSIPTQPGNSGGPIFNSQGQVVGVLTSQLNALALMSADGTVPQNINFAVKLDYLLPLVPAERRTTPDETIRTQGSTNRADQVELLREGVGQIVVR